MHLKRVEIKNIRSIEHLVWEPTPDEVGDLAGWHVILGENGSGKSTFLRAATMCTISLSDFVSIHPNLKGWIRGEGNYGSIDVLAVLDQSVDTLVDTTHGERPDWLKRNFELQTKSKSAVRGESRTSILRTGTAKVEDGEVDESFVRAQRDVRGHFSAAYGPFRRFSGGDRDQEKLFEHSPTLARHLSIFSESVSLGSSLEWLQKLQFEKLEAKAEHGLVDDVREFVNQPDFLPHGTCLKDVSSKSVTFVDANGFTVPVESLSDGFRSILSMTFELIRRLAGCYGNDRIFAPDRLSIVAPGVVMIDEIDAHLHPTWQREIGVRLRRQFPKIQFIVTTHSPIICQAAEKGSIFRLPRPGTSEKGEMITGVMRERLVYGDVLDAYSTGAFGLGSMRSDASQEKLERLAELNKKDLLAALEPTEAAEQSALRATLPTAASAQPGSVTGA